MWCVRTRGEDEAVRREEDGREAGKAGRKRPGAAASWRGGRHKAAKVWKQRKELEAGRRLGGKPGRESLLELILFVIKVSP